MLNTLSRTMLSYRSLNQQAGTAWQISALFLIAIMFASLATSFVAYQFGHRQGIYAVKQVQSEQVTSGDISALMAENAKLKTDISTLTKERDISMANIERLAKEQEQLQAQNLQLTQVNGILQSSVAEQGGIALKIIAAEIASLPKNIFEYRFDVAMIDVSGKSVRMTPRLTLLNDTSMVEIALHPSSYEINGVANIRGRFVMPKGFSPRQMKLELIAGNQKMQQLYNWRVGDINNRLISNN